MDYLERFQRLDAWLQQHQALWRARPFMQRQLAWEGDWPALAAYLRSRTLEQAEAQHNAPQLLDAPHPFTNWARQSLDFCALPEWSRPPSFSVPEQLIRHVPGRKQEQVYRFADVAMGRLPNEPERWLDWCAGKGHLGRLLAWQSGRPVICLEQDAVLNQQGRELSQQFQVTAEHIDADVLNAPSWDHLTPARTPVALHACGQLHMTLLEQAVTQRCPQLVIAPCCYNRIPGENYQPMSHAGRAAQLRLSRQDLSLPLQESVTAGQRVRRLRDQSMAWRLAFDIWQRKGRGVDAYLPTPSRPESAMGAGIAAYCRFFAQHHNLTLPEPEDWSRLESQGWALLAQVRNLELVGALFRRPLEIWLMLDRALYLQEAGYRVELGQFCPADLTPRNLMLIASCETQQLAPSL